MCGICGIYSFIPGERVDKPLLQSMNNALINRGPDDGGVYVKDNVGLGNRRLSIIDVKGGHQPIGNEDGTIWIAYNGEIYNFQEIRKELLQKGHRFQTHSDTEVIVHLYEEMGIECVTRLRGMFVFAIWDERKQRLFIARDRIGQKPLAYIQQHGTFYFASEIKALLQVPEIQPELNISALHHFLAYRTVPGLETIFEGIQWLPQGSTLVIENNQINIERYWHVDFSHKISRTLDRSCDELLELLDESVKMRLISEVPLGAFLSGGVDSSLVVAIMSKYLTEPVKTYSVGFADEKDYNEFSYADLAAARFETRHTNVVITPDDIKAILPDMVRYYDQPEVAFSHVMSFYLSKVMRRDMTVALSGIGPDELFGGYSGYHIFRILHLLDFLPKPLKQAIIQPVSGLLSHQRFRTSTQNIRKFLAMAMTEPERRKGILYSVFSDDLKGRLYTETFRNLTKEIDTALLLERAYHDSGTHSVIDAVLYTELLVTHEHSLVRDADLSGMAHGLEIRSPFLDHKMIEFAASVPFSMKARGMTLKYLVKKAAERLLPKEIIYRKKMGFGEYPTRWLRNEWRSFAYETLLDGPLKNTGYFQMHEIKSLLDEHTQHRHNHSRLLWTLIMLALWFEQVYTLK